MLRRLYLSVMLCVDVLFSFNLAIYVEFHGNYTVPTLRHVSTTIFDHLLSNLSYSPSSDQCLKFGRGSLRN